MYKERHMKIVIVDDNQGFRDIAYNLVHDIHGNPLEIIRFENAIKAWEDLLEEPADIVITDVSMPQMNGLELLERIKESSPETHVIVMSFQPGYKKEALRLGAHAFFEKPFDADLFTQTLHPLLNR